MRPTSPSPSIASVSKRTLTTRAFTTCTNIYASHAVTNSASMPVLSRLLGHSKVRMTPRHAHIANWDIEAAAERVGNDSNVERFETIAFSSFRGSGIKESGGCFGELHCQEVVMAPNRQPTPAQGAEAYRPHRRNRVRRPYPYGLPCPTLCQAKLDKLARTAPWQDQAMHQRAQHLPRENSIGRVSSAILLEKNDG